jgi:hypothetical protein
MSILLCKIQILVILLAENGKEGPMSEGVRLIHIQDIFMERGSPGTENLPPTICLDVP